MTGSESLPDFARQIASEGWSLDVMVESLVGFADSNFRLTDHLGERFVLKISPPGMRREDLECQISAMLHLSAGPFASLIPRVVPAGDGQVLLPVRGDSDRPRWARLVTYLEGTPLAKIDRRPPDLLEEIGRILGQLDLALVDFDHPGTHRDFAWDLTATLEHAPLATHIEEDDRRALIEAYLERFETTVAPRLSELEYTVIHNDANDYNLLVSTPGEECPHLTGVIDFGDILHTATIAELAIACAYLMLDRENPMGDAAHAIRGYNNERRLSALERELLPDLVLARICASVLHSAHGRHHDPDNAYLQVSDAPMWRLLERMTTEPDSFRTRVEAACQ